MYYNCQSIILDVCLCVCVEIYCNIIHIIQNFEYLCSMLLHEPRIENIILINNEISVR